jgi:hypothetical protein
MRSDIGHVSETITSFLIQLRSDISMKFREVIFNPYSHRWDQKWACYSERLIHTQVRSDMDLSFRETVIYPFSSS